MCKFRQCYLYLGYDKWKPFSSISLETDKRNQGFWLYVAKCIGINKTLLMYSQT